MGVSARRCVHDVNHGLLFGDTRIPLHGSRFTSCIHEQLEPLRQHLTAKWLPYTLSIL